MVKLLGLKNKGAATTAPPVWEVATNTNTPFLTPTSSPIKDSKPKSSNTSSGFFRKSEKMLPSTPPTTPSSPILVHPTDSLTAADIQRRRKGDDDDDEDEDDVRLNVETIDVPTAGTSAAKLSPSKDDSSPSSTASSEPSQLSPLEHRIDSGISDLTGAATTAANQFGATGTLPPTTTPSNAQDPPARILRTCSSDAPSTSSQSGNGILSSTALLLDPPPTNSTASQSLVTKVLGIVDLSCVSTGLMLDDDPVMVANQVLPSSSQYLHHQAGHHSHPQSVIRPEWGVAPIEDDEDGSNSSFKGSAVKSKLEPTSPTRNGSRHKRPKQPKRHETFELVYKETADDNDTMAAVSSQKKGKQGLRMGQWLSKSWRQSQQQPPTQTRGVAAAVVVDTSSTNDGTDRGDVVTASALPHVATATATRPPTSAAQAKSKPKKKVKAPDAAKATTPSTPTAVAPAETAAAAPLATVSNVFVADVATKVAPMESDVAPLIKKKKQWGLLKKRGGAAKARRRLSFPPNPHDKPMGSDHNTQSPALILDSMNHGRGGFLETVHEEDQDAVHEAGSLKVRVPGVQIADSFISDRDLIGSEVVDEIYSALDEQLALEHEERQERQRQAQDLLKQEQQLLAAEKEGSAVPQSLDDSPRKPVAAKETLKEALEQRQSPTTTVAAQLIMGKVAYQEFVDPVLPAAFDPTTIVSSSSPATTTAPIAPSKSWKQRLGLARSPDADVTEAIEEANTSSLSPRLTELSDKKKKKPVWKPAVDPATGKTYYFHKKTRETTWAKPPDDDIIVPKSKSKNAADAVKRNAEADPNSIVQTLEFGDADPVARKKQEIARMLTELSPPDESSVKKLVSQYDGREEELLTQLHVIAESKPFDEPVQTMDHPEDERKPTDEKSLMTRSRTGMSIYSGFSGRYSHKSRISELTQQIKNTSSNKNQQQQQQQPANALPSIPNVAASMTTSISTKVEGLPNPPVGSSTRTTTKIPKNIPVPRLRELNVEEFTMSDRAYGGRITPRPPKPVRSGPDATSGPAPQPEDKQVGENEDNDADKSTVSYAATDSISALSEADLSFVDRKEAADDVRRRALDRAIAQEDWDLAAQLSEGMRNNSKSDRNTTTTTTSRKVPNEWAQSDMDRFISDNDWDAMAEYIARLRANANEAGQKKMRKHLRGARDDSPSEHKRRTSGSSGRGRGPAPPSNHSDTSGASNPQKRFGARSQLQHRDLNPSAAEDSYSSYSSTYDSEYTSDSYDNYSDADQPQPTLKPPAPSARYRQPKAFAC